MAVKRININANSEASNVIKAAVANKKIRVLSLALVAAGAVTVTIEDGAGANMIGPMAFAANGGIVLSESNGGWGDTAKGSSLNMLLSAAVQVGGSALVEEIE